jgi:two-component system KDP operon response regulator KdpE
MKERPPILVIDDEPQIHRFLSLALDAAGYSVLQALTGAEGLRLAAESAPALILLDLGLPDQDGQALLPRLRGFCPAPVLVLSARDREAEKVQALDAGADDYVQKPFALGELLARIRAALRRTAGPSAATVLRIDRLEINLAFRLARIDGDAEPLKLTPREWELLVALARGEGRVLTHRQLLSGVWGPAHIQDAQYLRVYIGQLRQKLGPVASLLRTEPGVGYRFGEPG